MKLRYAGLLALAVGLAPLAAGAQNAGTTTQFPTSPWSAFAHNTVQCGWLYGANFNSTSDQAIPIAAPSSTYMIESVAVSNPSVSLTTAVGGVYSAASKGGVAVVANSQAYSSLTTNAANTTGNAMLATISTAGLTTAFTAPTTLYLSLTTPQGAAATADVRVRCRPLY